MFLDQVPVFKTILSPRRCDSIIPREHCSRYSPGEAEFTDGTTGDFAGRVGGKSPAGIAGVYFFLPIIDSTHGYLAAGNKDHRPPLSAASAGSAFTGDRREFTSLAPLRGCHPDRASGGRIIFPGVVLLGTKKQGECLRGGDHKRGSLRDASFKLGRLASDLRIGHTISIQLSEDR